MKKTTAIAVLVIITLIFYSREISASPQETVENYIRALIDENWSKAESLWHPDEIAKSKRFGITYDDIPAKYDCASPLMEALDGIRLGVVKYSVGDVQDHDGWFDITMSLSTPSDSTTHHYYVVPQGNSYVLASPLYLHTKDWKTRESKYCRLIYTDSTLINSHAIDELDRFIAKTCYLLNIPLTRRRHIESEKIDYYLCTQEQIRLLTGYDVQGVTILPLDAVVTRQLPHKHELSHLLINLRTLL